GFLFAVLFLAVLLVARFLLLLFARTGIFSFGSGSFPRFAPGLRVVVGRPRLSRGPAPFPPARIRRRHHLHLSRIRQNDRQLRWPRSASILDDLAGDLDMPVPELVRRRAALEFPVAVRPADHREFPALQIQKRYPLVR